MLKASSEGVEIVTDKVLAQLVDGFGDFTSSEALSKDLSPFGHLPLQSGNNEAVLESIGQCLTGDDEVKVLSGSLSLCLPGRAY
jgi:hypothetical protein